VKLFAPLPRFDKVGGFNVSFAVPGLVVVRTDINARYSVSGSTPLIVAR
jgi:hypothetical protein